MNMCPPHEMEGIWMDGTTNCSLAYVYLPHKACHGKSSVKNLFIQPALGFQAIKGFPRVITRYPISISP